MRRHLEDDEARALIRWRDLHARRYPQLALLFAIPNGGKRNAREGARMKGMGVKAGVSDYLLPVPAGPFEQPPQHYGLWLELKQGKGKPTVAQAEWLTAMIGQGYAAEVAHGWVNAARKICDYLGIKGIAP